GSRTHGSGRGARSLRISRSYGMVTRTASSTSDSVIGPAGLTQTARLSSAGIQVETLPGIALFARNAHIELVSIGTTISVVISAAEVGRSLADLCPDDPANACAPV